MIDSALYIYFFLLVGVMRNQFFTLNETAFFMSFSDRRILPFN